MLPVHRFNDFIAQNQLFDKNGTVLAALSGGMDSVLMVHLLARSGYQFAIAHCNFKLRGADAEADQDFCRELAQNLGATFHTIDFDTANYAAEHKISIQMAARQLRYQWFEQLRVQNAYTSIAVAHHQNDTIETILLNLIRGTGIAGLHGISPLTEHVARPLLFLQRGEIETFVLQNGLAYREDSSNALTKYARNKIRHEIIPKLKEINPSLETTFEKNLERFRQMEQLLELSAQQYREQITEHAGEWHLPIQTVRQMQPQQLMLFTVLQTYGFNEEQVSSIITSLDKHSGRVFESADYTLILDRKRFIISKKEPAPIPQIKVEAFDKELIYGQYRLSILHDDSALIVKDNPLATSVDADLLVYPLTLRGWQQGDIFYPLGMKGKQLLSDFFIQQKLPIHQKSKVPVMVNGNGEIVWLAGYRLDDRYKISARTKKVTIFELFNKA